MQKKCIGIISGEKRLRYPGGTAKAWRFYGEMEEISATRRHNEGIIMPIEKVAVIGAGVMGKGIAHICALGGFDVKLTDVSMDLLEKSLKTRFEIPD